LTAVLLADIDDKLLAIREYAEERRAEGITEPVEPLVVTSEPRRIRAEKPWFSVMIVNDGPNDVDVIVNTEKSFREHKVAADETYKVDMFRGVIKDVLLWCAPAETASVRFVGVR
jgi:hypothetical protein